MQFYVKGCYGVKLSDWLDGLTLYLTARGLQTPERHLQPKQNKKGWGQIIQAFMSVGLDSSMYGFFFGK